jgi:small basic protein (TIGR04137 family)
MSRHRSYGRSSSSAKKRNVLKRFERVDVLKKLGKWKEGESKRVTGLPKTPTIQ